jgi:hypothetical protein
MHVHPVMHVATSVIGYTIGEVWPKRKCIS